MQLKPHVIHCIDATHALSPGDGLAACASSCITATRATASASVLRARVVVLQCQAVRAKERLLKKWHLLGEISHQREISTCPRTYYFTVFPGLFSEFFVKRDVFILTSNSSTKPPVRLIEIAKRYHIHVATFPTSSVENSH